jgi:hypothetical protein
LIADYLNVLRWVAMIVGCATIGVAVVVLSAYLNRWKTIGVIKWHIFRLALAFILLMFNGVFVLYYLYQHRAPFTLASPMVLGASLLGMWGLLEFVRRKGDKEEKAK